ncbi:hypothetical protein FGB62_246g08 [Gracilaria domingensis]|nr:hypothetical protein FGB62_246g08 [Gracilaria domingensis]
MVIDKSGQEGNKNDDVNERWGTEDCHGEQMNVSLSGGGGGGVVGGHGRRSQALAFAYGILPITAYDIELKCFKTFRNAEIRLEKERFKIEMLAEVQKQEQHGAYRAKQRCSIPAHFSGGEDAAAAENQSTGYVYYGCVNKIWEITVQFRQPGEKLKQ